MLTGSFFMLQVYDRVLPGRSIPTLVALMVLATVLYLFQGDDVFAKVRILHGPEPIENSFFGKHFFRFDRLPSGRPAAA